MADDQPAGALLARKDLGLAVDLGRDVGVPAELSALVEQIFCRAKAAYGDLVGDMSPIRLYETWAGQDFRLPLPSFPAV
ncbi:NAD-binding protein [Amycolatopsis sp. NPDC024027]|uniref:NAD-binding protein n=1 Tax=Amycolatopsis sp. NPDC024027 TaxID=3154327 RepID=UPI00340B213A